jgi:hypothetical protein
LSGARIANGDMKTMECHYADIIPVGFLLNQIGSVLPVNGKINALKERIAKGGW